MKLTGAARWRCEEESMNRPVRLSEGLRHADNDEGRSLRMARRPRNEGS
jgi:hypothetical protein